MASKYLEEDMAKVTAIQWCDSSINPVPGCTGCELYDAEPAKNHCYAATLIRRYAGCKGWPNSFTEPKYFPGRIEKAIAWRDMTGTDRPGKPWLNGLPRLIFLNDLGDTFAPTAPDPAEWLLSLMDEMGKAPHIWMVLTKWPRRMCEFFETHPAPENFWPGTTILNQKWADRNIPWLLRTPAAVRFVSAEPLLGAMDLSKWLSLDQWLVNPLSQGPAPETIDWFIVGGESGPSARPMKLDDARSLVQQCKSAGIPVFVKQLGTVWAKNQYLQGKSLYAYGYTKGHEMRYWPEDLRVREMPGQRK